jgi:hypothetical protein
MNAIADTGLLVALARQNDRYHDWAAEVLTVDEAVFFVYRRNQREAIPLLCPPKKK